ncbi:MAG: nicotinamide mononucleotide transporter [Clostridiales bacterium]|nr:nicotinamide mononucleotide transporter [Clostridiales bacterium]
MKNWKGYNILDLFLIGLGVIVVTVAGIWFNSKWYVIINTLLGLLCVFTQAKGKISTQFIGIIYFCFYIFISYKQQYYGEAILYLIIMLPLYIYGVIHWLANRDKKDNVVIVRSNLSKKEWLISSLCFIILSIGVYFLLKVLDTAQLLISTLSFVSILPAVYLLMRRCKWNQVAFLINDFIVPILWLILVIKGDLSFLTMFIYYIFQVTYDIYGLIEWIKLEKKQQENI